MKNNPFIASIHIPALLASNQINLKIIIIFIKSNYVEMLKELYTN